MGLFILFIVLFIVALIIALFGTAHLILYRIFENSADKTATVQAVLTGTKITDIYRGKKTYSPVFEYTVGSKKYRRTVVTFKGRIRKNSEAVYLKAFPRIAYIRCAGNDFKENAAVCFLHAALFLFVSLTTLFYDLYL